MRIQKLNNDPKPSFKSTIVKTATKESESISKAITKLGKLDPVLSFHITDNKCGGINILAKINEILIASFHNGNSTSFNVSRLMKEWEPKMQKYADIYKNK